MTEKRLPASAHEVTEVCANCRHCEVVHQYESHVLLCVLYARKQAHPVSIESASTDEISDKYEAKLGRQLQWPEHEKLSELDRIRFTRRYRVWDEFCRRHQVVAHMSCDEYGSKDHVCTTEEWEQVVSRFHRYLMDTNPKKKPMSATVDDHDVVKSVHSGRLRYHPPSFPGSDSVP